MKDWVIKNLLFNSLASEFRKTFILKADMKWNWMSDEDVTIWEQCNHIGSIFPWNVEWSQNLYENIVFLLLLTDCHLQNPPPLITRHWKLRVQEIFTSLKASDGHFSNGKINWTYVNDVLTMNIKYNLL